MFSREELPYDQKFAGLYNLIYKIYDTIIARVPQYELRYPFGNRECGAVAKLYFNGDCRITVKESKLRDNFTKALISEGQYQKKEGMRDFSIAEPSSKELTAG